MSFESIVDDGQCSSHDGHPTITKANLEPKVQLSYNFVCCQLIPVVKRCTYYKGSCSISSLNLVELGPLGLILMPETLIQKVTERYLR